MGLRAKLFLPAILGFAVLASAIHFFWIPEYLAHEHDAFTQNQVKLVSTLEPEIARYILSGDLSALHVSLNKQRELNQPAWLTVSIYNHDNTRLYPIDAVPHVSGPNIYQHLHPIIFDGQEIAMLNLNLDWQPFLDDALAQIHRIELILLITIGIIGLASMVWLSMVFLRPLKHLESAATQLSNGDFSAPLPKQSRDELGNLIHSFAAMRSSLQSSQTELTAALVELQRNNVELTIAKHEAESSNRAKSNFLATMSHELRTPLNGMLGMAQLFNMTELDDEQVGYVDTIVSSGKDLLSIINDLLDFSKIEAGKLTLEEIAFDFHHEVQQVIQLLSGRLNEKELTLNLHYAPSCGSDYFVGDPGRIRQVLINLIGNAIKFTHHGNIDIDISCIMLSDEITALHIAIKDTGIGIPLDVQPRLFESFTQADTSTTRKYGGTGLGLAICKQLVELMGGSITVDSVPGAGSTFSFTLNLRRQPLTRLLPL